MSQSLAPFATLSPITAFEVCDAIGSPDYHFIPVGNAGNITAYWKGYKEYFSLNKISKLPKMMGFEATGSAAIVRGERILNPETIATAIRIGNPASWQHQVGFDLWRYFVQRPCHG